jgi:Aspartyl protease
MVSFPYGNTQKSRLPAPEIKLQAHLPTAPERRHDVICIVDTGASGTCLPNHILRSLNPLDYTKKVVEWGSGERTEVLMSAVNLVVGSMVFADLFVAGIEKPYGLIGRDLLNKYLLACDGLNLVWSVEPEWI